MEAGAAASSTPVIAAADGADHHALPNRRTMRYLQFDTVTIKIEAHASLSHVMEVPSFNKGKFCLQTNGEDARP